MSTQSARTESNATAQDSPFSELLQAAMQAAKDAGVADELRKVLAMTPEQRTERRAAMINAERGNLDASVIDCPTCRNKGFIAEARGLEIVHVECGCMVQRRAMRRMKASGLQGIITACRLDNFATEESFQREMKGTAERFLHDGGHGLLMSGQSGCGKTHICTAVCAQLIKRGHDVIYMPYRDEIMRIKQAARDADEYQPRMQQLKAVDVLYIDDLFKGDVRAADVNAVYELVGYRDRASATTIVSTELTIGELSAIDEAIAGRIVKMCGGRSGFIVQVAKDADKNHRMK